MIKHVDVLHLDHHVWTVNSHLVDVNVSVTRLVQNVIHVALIQ